MCFQLKGCVMNVKKEIHDVQELLHQIEDLKKQLAEAKSTATVIIDDVVADVKELSSALK